jgi:hypothetical protein
MQARRKEADEFYASVIPASLDADVVVVIELLGPEHAGQGLAHHIGGARCEGRLADSA